MDLLQFLNTVDNKIKDYFRHLFHLKRGEVTYVLQSLC